jgi:site-specific recombinase XerD
MACFKTILMPAIKSGRLKPDPFINFKIRIKAVPRNYLSIEEISKLEDMKQESPDLVRIKDIFLFACYTGLAYIDLRKLSLMHIAKDVDGSYFIRISRQKTGQESIIPLLPAAIRILLKYSRTGELNDLCWRVSYNQKMNQRLKTIGKVAGISKPLHMHLARHTFATTITLSSGVSIESVSSMLGHANINQTQHYAKITPLKLNRIWRRFPNYLNNPVREDPATKLFIGPHLYAFRHR